MRAPAWWRQFRAWLGGWFWIPCPRCGDYFAGYEDGDVIPHPDGRVGHGLICCRYCSEVTR